MGAAGAVGPLEVEIGAEHRVLGPGEVLTIGRDPAVGLAIDDARVSRRHLKISAESGQWAIEDLASSNGTFCDGHRVDRMAVSDATSLRLGDGAIGPEVRLSPVAAPPVPGPGDTVIDLGTVEALHRPTAGVTTIGRDPANDIVLDDLMVSRRHAELRTAGPGRYEIVDLDSHNGTFVNGRRVYRIELRLDDMVRIGRHTLAVTEEGLTEFEERGGVAYAASGLGVLTKTGTAILEGISFALEGATFLGVVGPSGSGKSTLVNALTGQHPADSGSVFYAGRDLYLEFEHLRRMIGFVPQDDVLHMELTVRRTLEFAAELRFPPDVSTAERSARVDEVLEELGLVARSDVVISNLSGGQRKRVSVALELLTQPSLLILDEPTSGLDPGYERSLMELLARLARAGRTVVVVTHSVQSLHLCDRVMCLAPGGRMAWFGPPDRLTDYFGRHDYQEVFSDLSEIEGQVWQDRFTSHPDHARFVAEPLARYRSDPSGPRPDARLAHWAWFRQFSVLTRRYLATILADRRTLMLLFGVAIALALLLLLALPAGELGTIALPKVRLVSKAPLVLLTLVLGATQLGAFNSIREIAKELPLYRRERAVGLSISAYVASKAVVLGLITVFQVVLLTLISTARQSGPETAVLFGWPLGEFMLVMVLSGLAAMALGLLVSASLNTVDRAMTMLPVILILQMVLAAGGIFPEFTEKPGLLQGSFISSAQWGFAGTAAVSDLNELQRISTMAADIPIVDLSRPFELAEQLMEVSGGPSRFSHDATAYVGSLVALVAITAVCLVATALVLRRHDAG